MYAAFMFINATHWRLTCDVQGAFAFTMKKKSDYFYFLHIGNHQYCSLPNLSLNGVKLY